MEIKTPYIWKNGTLIAWDDAIDHNLTHSLHYGGGVFEGIRFYDTNEGPKVFRLEEHIDRLIYSANFVGINLELSKEELINATLDLVKANPEKSGYIRPIVYSGYGKMGLNPAGAKIETVISLWKWGKYLSEEGVNVKISSIRRIHPKTTDMGAKISGNYVNSILVSNDIHSQGFDEGLLLDTDGFVAEGPGENIFFIKNNEVFTPELGTILPGITRDSIIKILKNEFDIIVIEKKITPEEIKNFDEAFFCGTAAEITPISSITLESNEKVNFNSSKENSLSKKIKKLYLDIVNGKVEKYKNWLY